MKKFTPYYKHLLPVKWQFALGVLCGLLYSAASGAGLPLMTKLVFPILFHAEKTAASAAYDGWMRGMLGGVSESTLLLVTCLWIPVIFLVRGLAGYANTYLIQFAGFRVLEAIRTDLFIKLQSLPLAFFHRNRAGDLLARMMSDTEILRQVIAQASNDLVKQPFTLIFAVATLVYFSISNRSIFIVLIALLSVPFCVLIIRAAGKRLARRARALQVQNGDLTANLTESLQAALEIRAYNMQERQISLFRQKVRQMLKLTLKVVRYRAAISPMIEVVSSIGFATALYIGVKKGMKLEDFMAVGMALYMAYEPVKKLGNIHSLFRQGESAVERMEFILHEPDSMPDPEHPAPAAPPRRVIRFENVSFAYAEDPVLSEVDLEIPVGSTVALIGPSGAGKTTFASLIPRFYDPTSGSIRFDGTDIRDYAKAGLRSMIAVVPQMPALFSGTIEENIALGRPGASPEEIREAARRAHAANFIEALPGGYAYEVGERGGQLSGGQRQRVAIARAFLRDAPVLILDEATSALDTESEAMVQQALADLVKGRTTFIIAHRFSTITIAGRILVFENGRIAADGTHEQLAATNTTYQAMQGGLVVG